MSPMSDTRMPVVEEISINDSKEESKIGYIVHETKVSSFKEDTKQTDSKDESSFERDTRVETTENKQITPLM